jgi:hypothetical protein
MDHQYLCETITNSVMQYLGSEALQSRSDAFFWLEVAINRTKMTDTVRHNTMVAYKACGKYGDSPSLEPVWELQRLLSSYDRSDTTTDIGFQIWSYVHWSRIELDAAYAAEHDE